jgi:hypothetical protein
MGPVVAALTAGLLCIAIQLVALGHGSFELSGNLMLVCLAITLLSVFLTAYRICGATR